MLDDDSGLCAGCGRSRDEIARWINLTPQERRAIMNILPERLKKLESTDGAVS